MIASVSTFVSFSACASLFILPWRRAGQHVIVFVERGPLYLVAAAATGEPAAALVQQLDLLHAHLLAILTDGFDRTLARNPRFEPRRLLGAACDISGIKPMPAVPAACIPAGHAQLTALSARSHASRA